MMVIFVCLDLGDILVIGTNQERFSAVYLVLFYSLTAPHRVLEILSLGSFLLIIPILFHFLSQMIFEPLFFYVLNNVGDRILVIGSIALFVDVKDGDFSFH